MNDPYLITRRRVLGAGAGLMLSSTDPTVAATTQYDVVIYGATPSGIMAADTASRGGARVLLLEPSSYVGGQISQAGVSPIDLWSHSNIGGRTWQWLQAVAIAEGVAMSGAPTSAPASSVPGNPGYVPPAYLTPQPKTTQTVFESWITQTGVNFLRGAALVTTGGSQAGSVKTSGLRITSLNTTQGSFSGKIFIDASYEGDIMAGAARAGIVFYTIGREPSGQYGEGHAGWTNVLNTSISGLRLLDSNGQPLAPLLAAPNRSAGSGDARAMAADYRFIIKPTTQGGTRAFFAPTGYDPKLFKIPSQLFLLRNYQGLAAVANTFVLNGGKSNVDGAISPVGLTLLNAINAYAEGTPAQRAAIVQQHFRWTAGLMYFMATDPSVPAQLRGNVSSYGLAADEWPDNRNWPRQLYVREGRRLIGRYVVTQADLTGARSTTTTICLGSYVMDCKTVTAYAADASTIVREGTLYDTSSSTWPIPMESMMSNAGQCTNLLVPVCSSTSHVAWTATRMEPTFMMMGEAAGVVAAQAALGGLAVQNVGYAGVRASLLSLGARLA